MQIALDLAVDPHMPLQGRVVKQIQHLIREGVLRPGARLPGTRELSSQLNISRNTVTLAYERLTAEGFLSMREGDGTFVSDCPPGGALVAKPTGAPTESAGLGDRLPPYKRDAGVLHGGAILSFIDTILGHAVVNEARKKCATISLDSRFIGTAAPGAWIGGRATLRKLTRSFAFVDAEAFEGDRLLVTATAIFRVFDA